MKAKEYRTLSSEKLKESLSLHRFALSKSYAMLNIDEGTRHPGRIKKEIAKILTILRERNDVV